MVKIDCLKEKRALIAMYFCGKEKRTVSPEQVFGSWTTWWKDDCTKSLARRLALST